jgi:predicted unusual protein kinase regulating ubiquinone biosynthesis (AarF/ABC1/UbiB family)
MKIPIKPRHVKRYKEFALLLLKYGHKELVHTIGLDQAFAEEGISDSVAEGAPEQLAKDLEELGPTFIKMGQILSTRPDLLSPPYLEALSRLQDAVEPFPFEEVEKIISEELGVRMSIAFEEFDPGPIAAASLGQVHQATLRDGRVVAVKVQRPGIREKIVEDLDILDEIAALVDQYTELGRKYAFQQMLYEFRRTLLEELDYRQEANNLVSFGENLRNYENIVVPKPIPDYSTAIVLTMDFIRGTKITDISPLIRTEMDCRTLAEDLLKAYLDQILLEGFFHADPHPGNIFLTEDGKLGLLDIGMVARLDPSVQDILLKLLLAVSDGRGYEAAERIIQMGKRLKDFDESQFKRHVGDLVSRYRNANMRDLQIGRIVLELARISGANGLRPPIELTILGKTLLNLDEVGRLLAPEFNPNEVIRGHSQTLMRRHMLKSLAPGNVFSATLEVQEFLQKLPTRLNRVLDSLARNEIELKIHAFDENRLMRSLEKIANRIALGTVLAALIVGAAMIMRIESTLTILGYPAIAIVLFLLAAMGGMILIASILLGDRRK